MEQITVVIYSICRLSICKVNLVVVLVYRYMDRMIINFFPKVWQVRFSPIGLHLENLSPLD